MTKSGSIILLLTAALTALSLSLLPRLTFNFDIEQLFPEDSPEVEIYQRKVLPFESKKAFEVIGIAHHESVFQRDFLQKIHRLTRSLDSLPGVRQATSLPPLSISVFSFFGKKPPSFF
ncbi:MAG: hypothetical protein R3B47_07600 [Bacteroidia bacterium]